MCGGTLAVFLSQAFQTGLSPRVRGNLELECQLGIAGRSIPACAGEPTSRRAACRTGEVYPRVCGGTQTCLPHRGPGRGLSPRVRGNLDWRDGLETLTGSIPACAGEPVSRVNLTLQPKVYPRVCGGTGIDVEVIDDTQGLSPRVRGNQPPLRWPAVSRRSIPACAGEPLTLLLRLPHARVYPRVCGGTACPEHESAQRGGLSPRVRGNRPYQSCPICLRRSIPACAGEPRY